MDIALIAISCTLTYGTPVGMAFTTHSGTTGTISILTTAGIIVHIIMVAGTAMAVGTAMVAGMALIIATMAATIMVITREAA